MYTCAQSAADFLSLSHTHTLLSNLKRDTITIGISYTAYDMCIRTTSPSHQYSHKNDNE